LTAAACSRAMAPAFKAPDQWVGVTPGPDRPGSSLGRLPSIAVI